MRFVTLHYKTLPIMINADHIIRVRDSVQTVGGSYLDFVGGAKQEVDESIDVVSLILTNNLLLG